MYPGCIIRYGLIMGRRGKHEGGVESDDTAIVRKMETIFIQTNHVIIQGLTILLKPLILDLYLGPNTETGRHWTGVSEKG